jgi:hypothetical protein
LNGGEETRLLTELHCDSLYPMMGKDAWVAGADRGEAPGPTPVRLGPTPQVGFPPLRLRRQPPGSLQLWNGGVQRGVSKKRNEFRSTTPRLRVLGKGQNWLMVAHQLASARGCRVRR